MHYPPSSLPPYPACGSTFIVAVRAARSYPEQWEGDLTCRHCLHCWVVSTERPSSKESLPAQGISSLGFEKVGGGWGVPLPELKRKVGGGSGSA